MTDMRRLIQLVETANAQPVQTEIRPRGDGRNDIRAYMDILHDHALLESRADQYKQMFAPLQVLVDASITGSLAKILNDYMKLALSFTRNDRIVWALNTLRAIFVESCKAQFSRMDDPQVAKVINKYSDNRYMKVAEVAAIESHYLKLPFYKIQDFVFPPKATPTDIIKKMKELEQEFKDRKKGLVTQQEGDEIILEFPNGMMWMMLSRGGCSEEADAMGHCGNGSGRTGQNILSLRKFRKEIDGEKLYEPFLTFIREDDGRLGEMKGKNNDKPVAAYHPEIIALLKLPLITGITGGGYLPEHNFSINDLTPAQQDDLLDVKPNLGTWLQTLRRVGLNQSVQEQFHNAWNTAFGNKDWRTQNDAMIVDPKLVRYKAYENLHEFVEANGDRSMKYWADIVLGGEHLDMGRDYSEDDAKSFYSDLSIAYKKVIIHNLLALKPEDHDDDSEHDFEDMHPSNIVSLLKEFGEEVYDQLTRAVEDGDRAGHETEAYDNIQKAVSGIKFATGTFVFTMDNVDGPIFYEFTPDEASKLMEGNDSYNDTLEISELATDTRFPLTMRDDIDGYDAAYARTSFEEQFDDRHSLETGVFFRADLTSRKGIIQAIKELNEKSIPAPGLQPLLKLTYSTDASDESLKKTFKRGYKEFYGRDYYEPPAKESAPTA